MLSRNMKFALGLAVVVMLGGAAYAQDGRWWGQNRDGYYNQERRENQHLYQQGVRDGREDREHHRAFRIRDRHWDDRQDRDAYVAGYREGFGGSDWRGDRDRDDRGVWGGRGNGGYQNVRNQAYNVGYQDGLRDGQNDRRTGHSFRPTQGDNYKHADRGYNSSMGGKQAYKDDYRSGYGPGYDRGYNGR